MKTFDELTEDQKIKAVELATSELLNEITEQGIRFDDALNESDLQARIDAAGEKAERMRTPWFWHEYIMDTCSEDINAMAQCQAEDSLYHDGNQRIVVLKNI